MNAKRDISASGSRLAEDDDPAPRGGLIILNEEDGAADTIIPRLLVVVDPISSYLGESRQPQGRRSPGRASYPTRSKAGTATAGRRTTQMVHRCVAAR